MPEPIPAITAEKRLECVIASIKALRYRAQNQINEEQENQEKQEKQGRMKESDRIAARVRVELLGHTIELFNELLEAAGEPAEETGDG